MNSPSPAGFKRDILVLLMIMTLGCITSCREEVTAPMPQLPAIVDWGTQGPESFERFTLPLQGNNQWVYADTVFDYASVRVESVTHVATEDGVFRYQMSNTEPGGVYFSFDFVYVRNDTVFLTNPNSWQQGAAGILYLPAHKNQDTATIQFWGSISIHVYPLGHTFVVPAGVFDSVYVYDSRATNGVLQYFRPGIGVLETEVFDGQDTSVVLVKSQLLYYVLNQY